MLGFRAVRQVLVWLPVVFALVLAAVLLLLLLPPRHSSRGSPTGAPATRVFVLDVVVTPLLGRPVGLLRVVLLLTVSLRAGVRVRDVGVSMAKKGRLRQVQMIEHGREEGRAAEGSG